MANAPESECRVFALIIGIDQYKNLHSLKGCVNDANDFKDFLTNSLHVPSKHIVLLTNEMATRANILSNFQSHLINNPSIRKLGGDTIIWFFAGHGSRVDAPNHMFSTDNLVETICPYDQSGADEKENTVHGIPDFTVHTLMHKLAEQKGNNLTAIFDSCNSGGLGRIKGEKVLDEDDDTPRFAETVVPIPKDLDDDLGVNLRVAGPVTPKGFRFPFMESHILLAACRHDQIAYETTVKGIRRGRFSENLMRTLREISLEKTTYMQLIDLLQTRSNQIPQVEGKNKGRALFNGTYPPIPKNAVPVEKTAISGAYKIMMGSVEGVVTGTEFLINDAGNNTLGFLSAHTVSLDHSILQAKENEEPVAKLPDGAKATVSNWNNVEMIMKIYVSPHFDTSATSDLFPDTSHLKSLPIPRKFVQEASQAKADIELKKLSDDKFAVERLGGIIKDTAHVEPAIGFSLTPDKYNRLPVVMDGISHFNYFLHKHHAGDPILEVSMEMHKLTGPFLNRVPSADIFVEKVAKIKYTTGRKYGFTICNRSQHDLFPYLYYFDPAEYTIEEWYAPPAPRTAPLVASPNGRDVTRLPIGYGAGGYAFEFELPKDKKVDTGFLKVFVSTEYLDLTWIEQKSPFHPDFQGRKGRRETFEKGSAWDAFQAVVMVGWDFPEEGLTR
ncbi:caspase domain-containing protein [Mycena vulgaris]|nr:caspase domain-containing protein [Mycena vulgaris]